MLKWVAAVIAAVLILGEVAARAVGLGSPPLSITHPTIEYMFAPNQDVMRFHHRVLINQWGMRSEPVEKTKGDRNEFRVLALGDSVLNGGVLTDQSDLATTILSSGSTRILNVSAASWGPQNMLAYVKTFGFFDADMTVIVLSSHDAGDVPTFAPLDPNTHPTSRPLFALQEAIVRYLPRCLPHLSGTQEAEPAAPAPQSDAAIPALKELLALARSQGPVCVILHATRDELRAGGNAEGLAQIEAASAAAGARTVRDAQLVDAGRSYLDDIHLSPAGQRDLAAAFHLCLDGERAGR